MLQNFLTIAWRNAWRNKGLAAINLAGLTVGITCSIVLYLIVEHELSFDTFNAQYDRIYRVVNSAKNNNSVRFSPGVSPLFADAFQNDFPEAAEVVFISNRSSSLVTVPQKNQDARRFNSDNGLAFTQSAFFRIFDRPIIGGDAVNGLDKPNQAIISRKSALRYFGKEDVIGEGLFYDNTEYTISAVMEDYGSNTDFPFDLLLSYATIKKQNDENGWGSIWSDEQCYFLLKENESIEVIRSRIPDFIRKYHGEKNDSEFAYFLQPLKDLHFDERFETFGNHMMSRSTLYSLAVIAFFLVITACVNFINLTTAESIKRSKEVGIRKSMGSSRRQLVAQFLGETSMATLVAVLLSLAATQAVLLFLNPFLQTSLSLASGSMVWIFVSLLFVFVSLLSGLYPSFVVSAFSPASAMKNLTSSKNASGYALRRGLVVLQFFISQFFVIGTLVIIEQVDFVEHADLGFNKEAVVTVPIPVSEKRGTPGPGKMHTLKNEILALAGVQSASLSNSPPSSDGTANSRFTVDGNPERFRTQVKTVDNDYIDLFQLRLIAGTNILDLDTATGVLVNEKLARVAGFSTSEDIVGNQLTMWGRRLPVVGVIKDFNTVSLHNEIQPVVLFNWLEGYENLSIKISSTDLQVVIREIQKRWETAYPEFVFSYSFLDEDIHRFYEDERKMSTLLSIFSSMAIFIGCLGLFGLVAFMANQKTKEIGVRKVLGASVESILLLFSKEFVKLILMGFALSVPVAWYLMNQYLNQFAYKITLGPALFAISLAGTLLIAMLTVSVRSLRAAMTNPVDSLRSE